MNARQLEVFRAIMLNRSLTAAAAALNVSQPAVSKLLRHFEAQLGYRLFERVSGRLVPTAEAHLLFEDADRIFREIEVLQRFSRRIREKEVGLLRVAASAPPSFSILPAALVRFRRRNPGIRLILHTLPAEEIAAKIVIGEIDLGITMTTIEQPLVHSEVLGTASIVAVLPESSPLAAGAVVTPADLRDHAIISYGSQPRVGQLLDRAFEAAGIARAPQIEISLSIAAAPLIQRGLGVGLVDGLVPWRSFAGLVVRPFEPRIDLQIVLATTSAWAPSRFTKEFGRDIRAALADLAQAAPA
ncbi:MAG: LysR family transcriptional regulator [Alphaproteobacteria bacterium]|nr:LysR family transcriptional regulator [Alphaproteobacteria bacterium]